MIQEFYKTTVISKFIKQLLAKTPLPIYKLINDNDVMEAGCIYAYKDCILKCTKTGRFIGTRGTTRKEDYLYVQEPLYVADAPAQMTVKRRDPKTGNIISIDYPFAVTDDIVDMDMYPPAEYTTIERFNIDEYVPGVTQTYISNCSFYDEYTHYKLGEYLRYVSNMYNVNLMPLYNCYTGKTVNDVELFTSIDDNGEFISGVTNRTSDVTKTILVPIKFNTSYTIAIDSDFPVLMKSIFYNDGIILDSSGQKLLVDYVNEPVTEYSKLEFSKPVCYSLNSFDVQPHYSMLHTYERYLYLAIQVPVNNNSSIVVIEGDYSNIPQFPISDSQIVTGDTETSNSIARILSSKLSLLQVNDGKQRPFSDKLVQYLLRNTIDNRDSIDNNISYIEEQVGYLPVYRGIWDDELRYILFMKYNPEKSVLYRIG